MRRRHGGLLPERARPGKCPSEGAHAKFHRCYLRLRMDVRLFTFLNWRLLLWLFALYLVGVGNLYSASGTRIESGLLS